MPFRPRTLGSVVLGALCLLQACASTAPPAERLVPAVTASSAPSALEGAVRVARPAAQDRAIPLWSAQLDSASFNAALERSLREAGYLAPDAEAVRYVVTAAIEHLDQPLEGVTYDIASRVRYRVSGGGAIREYPVTARARASVLDHIVGAERLRIASARSLAANIDAFLEILATY